MDMSDDWAEEPEFPEHVPPKDDRLWAHPSEYRGPEAKKSSHRIVILLASLGLILLGLIIAKTAWPSTTTRAQALPASTLKIGNNTTTQINALSRAIVTLVVPGKGKTKTTLYGLAISPDGYILIPASVIGTAKSFTASANGNDPLTAKLVAEDPSTDTAVLKVAQPLAYYVSGTSERTAQPGEMTIGIGPNSTSNKPTLVISQIQQADLQESLSTGQTSDNVYLADPAQKLNPEGLLFVDSQGKPLGLGLGTTSNKWVIAPLSEMLASAQKIELQHGVPRGWLGIVGETAPSGPTGSRGTNKGAPSTKGSTETTGNASSNKGAPSSTATTGAPGIAHAAKGVIVYSVVANSPAKKAGIRAQDEIIALDNRPVTGLSQLQSMLSQLPSGSQVALSVLRNGQTLHFSVQLGVKSSS